MIATWILDEGEEHRTAMPVVWTEDATMASSRRPSERRSEPVPGKRWRPYP